MLVQGSKPYSFDDNKQRLLSTDGLNKQFLGIFFQFREFNIQACANPKYKELEI